MALTKESLLSTAGKLHGPTETAARAFAEKRALLLSKVIAEINARPDLDRLVGEGNRQMAEDNCQNLARFMESLFLDYHPETLVETVLWVFRAYRSHGFYLTYWSAHLETWVRQLQLTLDPADFEQLYPFYHWIITHIPAFTQLSEVALPPKG
jgi:hypothetical protein